MLKQILRELFSKIWGSQYIVLTKTEYTQQQDFYTKKSSNMNRSYLLYR